MNDPVLRVVNPDATEEEVAALVAVFASLGSGQASTPPRSPEWQSPRRRLRRPISPGPSGWRSSGLPG